ncbi:hypothetical protein BOX15_Mlig017891g1 [Macrostomum lignano]|uniref:CUB domain-containing protein n=1 Tax=Macrostomum lignano TaxID=282301 RepID=A0A267GDX5_9PLAT|nr:hypothetical protein BOX15_Mlig017891g1 [Macrostomum lignano]
MAFILLLIFVHCLISCAEAGHYYCGKYGMAVNMTEQSGPVDHLILPWEEGRKNSPKILSCKWQLSGRFSRNVILLLRGFDTEKVDLSLRRVVRSAEHSSLTAGRIRYRFLPYEYFVNGSCSAQAARGWQSVELKTLRVLQLPRRSNLHVEFDTSSSGNPHDTPGLRIQLMEPGFCSSDVVCFEHSCYTISSARRSLKAELTAICSDGGLTQLASFNSSSALQNFVAQSQRTRVGTGLDAHRKTPLNLTQPVRIGILHDRLTDSIFYLSNSHGELELKPLVESKILYYNVWPTSSRFSCGSLRLAQTADGTEVSFGVVEFVSCSESLPALLSFRDTARNCCCGCSARAVLSQIEKAESHVFVYKTFTESSNTTPIPKPRLETVSKISRSDAAAPKSDSTDIPQNFSQETETNKVDYDSYVIPFFAVLAYAILSSIGMIIGACYFWYRIRSPPPGTLTRIYYTESTLGPSRTSSLARNPADILLDPSNHCS